MAILKQLLEKYPRIDFWEKVYIEFKVRSLGFYLTPRGDGILKSWYDMFNFTPQEVILKPVEVCDSKVGEDKKIKKKPNLKELLS